MISFEEAHKIVLANSVALGTEKVLLSDSLGRILAEDVVADRDFPPFDRVTKDGIAISFKGFENGIREFKVQEVAAAGVPQKELSQVESCIEVMTGAMLPKNSDTVVMYEHLEIDNKTASLRKEPQKGQNIHYKGSDEPAGSLLLRKNQRVTAAEIGVLASVGKSSVHVKKLPKVATVSTGDELVEVDEIPKPHQIRKSNTFSLEAALRVEGIQPVQLHFKDSIIELEKGIRKALKDFDVLLISGGVSKGKFDFLPQVLQKLGVVQLFHKVKQRPGKPFWFGKHDKENCTIFAFPGNPGSTFANYHVHFLPWLSKTLETPIPKSQVVLNEDFENAIDFTRFMRASVNLVDGHIKANLVKGNGSGDLTSLSQSNGFVVLEPSKEYKSGDVVPFFATRRIL